jgi:hypothetical protein
MKKFLLALILLICFPLAASSFNPLVVCGGQPVAAGGECTVDNDSLLESIPTFSKDGADSLNTDTELLGQGFQNSNAFTLTMIGITISDTSQTGSITMTLYNDNSGEPDETSPVSGGSVTLLHGDVADSETMTYFVLASPIELLATTVYHAVLSRSDSGVFGMPYDGNEYAGGQECGSADSGSNWNCYSGAYDYDIEVWGCE